jgi:orotidine-5'-phosphate decarboxylase
MGPEILRKPQERSFDDLLERKQISANTLLCVNLDPDFPKGKNIKEFNRTVIDATHDLVCCYKTNSAFYEVHGSEGSDALRWTVDYIKNEYRDIPVILDAKRADADNTNLSYARMAFDLIGVDAITVNPYLGGGALEPFLERKDKGVIVLCRTSNKSAPDIQDFRGDFEEIGKDTPLYQVVAYKAAHEWNKYENISLVVGATYPEELVQVRNIIGNMKILVTGLGAQGGESKDIALALDSNKRGIIASVGRAIIFPKLRKGELRPQAIRRKAMEWRNAINVFR